MSSQYSQQLPDHPAGVHPSQTVPPTYQGAPGAYRVPDPGQSMSIVGLVLAVIMAPVGLVVSYLAHRKSKQAGFSNTLAKVGMAVGGILSTVFLIVAIVVSVTLYNVWQTCQELGPGVHQRGDVIYTCN